MWYVSPLPWHCKTAGLWLAKQQPHLPSCSDESSAQENDMSRMQPEIFHQVSGIWDTMQHKTWKFKRDVFNRSNPTRLYRSRYKYMLNDNITNKRGEHRTDQEAGWRSCRLTSKFFGSPDIWHFDGFTPAISSFTLVQVQRVFYKNISKNKYLFLSMYKNEPPAWKSETITRNV